MKEENLQFDVVVALTSPDKGLVPEEFTEEILKKYVVSLSSPVKV